MAETNITQWAFLNPSVHTDVKYILYVFIYAYECTIINKYDF